MTTDTHIMANLDKPVSCILSNGLQDKIHVTWSKLDTQRVWGPLHYFIGPKPLKIIQMNSNVFHTNSISDICRNGYLYFIYFAVAD